MPSDRPPLPPATRRDVVPTERAASLRRLARAALRRLGIALLLAPAVALPALAQDSAFDTSRMLEYGGNDCIEVPGCVTVSSPWVSVANNTVQVVAVDCPANQPYAWHWDTEQHEHIAVRLVARSASSISLRASNNQTGAAGSVRAYVGCSAKPFDPSGAGTMVSRSGVPSKRWQPDRKPR